MNAGLIYILSNEILKENLIKIGKTKKTDTFTRSKQLSSSTSIPEQFKVEREFKFFNVNKFEKIIHLRLIDFRYKKNKEFFNCDITFAEKIIKEEMIVDLNEHIKNLEVENAKILNELNSFDFIFEKWKYFFKNLNWNYHINIGEKNHFILDTKFWDVDYGKNVIYNDKTLVFVSNKSNIKGLSSEELTAIENYKTKKIRLLLLFKQPIKKEFLNEIILGYSMEFDSWEEQRILHYKSGDFGLFTDNETWFDFINGRFINRTELIFADMKIIEKWK